MRSVSFVSLPLQLFFLIAVSASISSAQVTYPTQRYFLYQSLDANALSAADTLEYTKKTWDVPGTAEIELLSFETINSGAVDQSAAIESLGINEESWDCYIVSISYFDEIIVG